MRFWTHQDKRQKVRAQIKDIVQTLKDGIVSYPLVEFEPWHSRGIRRAVAGEYNIFYQVFPEDKKSLSSMSFTLLVTSLSFCRLLILTVHKI